MGRRFGGRVVHGGVVGRGRRVGRGPDRWGLARCLGGVAPLPRAADQYFCVFGCGGTRQQDEPREDPRGDQVEPSYEHEDRWCRIGTGERRSRSGAMQPFWSATA